MVYEEGVLMSAETLGETLTSQSRHRPPRIGLLECSR
jgi:hypothetical protein